MIPVARPNPTDGLCSLATLQPLHHNFHDPNQPIYLLSNAALCGGCSGIVYFVPPDRVAKCPNAGSISKSAKRFWYASSAAFITNQAEQEKDR